jgi:hypothetical protein
MRGAERPSQVRWTRPFIPQLETLSRDAALKTLAAIVDDEEGDATRSEVHELLDFTDNMPLAVTLMGAIVSFEGYAHVLERWRLETTSVLSDGYAKNSNLEHSISISLSSPRMLAGTGSRELLSILSLLPNGISDAELTLVKFPITNIMHAKATLLRTSLAHTANGRLKVLAPVRQYVAKTFPPTVALVQPLITYLSELLLAWREHGKMPSGDLVPRLKANIGNLKAVLLHTLELEQRRDDLIETGHTLLRLQHFMDGTATKADVVNADYIRKLLPVIVARADDDSLHGRYLASLLDYNFNFTDAVVDSEPLIQRAVQHFKNAGNAAGEGP